MTALASPGQLRASFMRWALFTVPLILLLGYASGWLGGDPGSMWFQSLEKPAIFPPPAAFGIVWAVMFLLEGIALALVCAAWGARLRTAALAAFALQFLLSLAWTPTFFAMHEIKAAMAVIGALAVVAAVTAALFWRVRKLAAVLLLPYLAWIIFASVLNWQFLQLNPDASGGDPVPANVQRIEL